MEGCSRTHECEQAPHGLNNLANLFGPGARNASRQRLYSAHHPPSCARFCTTWSAADIMATLMEIYVAKAEADRTVPVVC